MTLAPDAWQRVQLGVRAQQAGTLTLSVGSAEASGYADFDDLTVEQTGGMIVQEQHQSAYGVPLVGLNYAVDNQRYRYGYQGQYAEHDAETGYEGFELRLYNARIGRWTAPDPAGQYDSPYVGMGNEPVLGVDPDGGLACCGGGGSTIIRHGQIAGFREAGRAAARTAVSSTTRVASTAARMLPGAVLHAGVSASSSPRDKVYPTPSTFTREWAKGNWFSWVVNYDAVNTLWLAPQLVIPGDSRRNFDGTFASQRSSAFAFYSTLGIAADGLASVGAAAEGGSIFFEGAKYSDKVLRQMGKADDLFHGFPKSIDGFATKYGQWSTKLGADGKTYQWLKMPGSYGGRTGVFEYTKGPNGLINHRFFNVPKAP